MKARLTLLALAAMTSGSLVHSATFLPGNTSVSGNTLTGTVDGISVIMTADWLWLGAGPPVGSPPYATGRAVVGVGTLFGIPEGFGVADVNYIGNEIDLSIEATEIGATADWSEVLKIEFDQTVFLTGFEAPFAYIPTEEFLYWNIGSAPATVNPIGALAGPVALSQLIPQGEALYFTARRNPLAPPGFPDTTEHAGLIPSFSVVAIPEPSTTLLGGLGLFALVMRRRRA